MSQDEGGDPNGAYSVPARALPVPDYLSPNARAYLTPLPAWGDYPDLTDKAAWATFIAKVDEGIFARFPSSNETFPVQVTEKDAGEAQVFDIAPSGLEPDDRSVILDMHGGALILCGGPLCKAMGVGTAMRLGRRVWSIDYRMPPDHPFPAALDDCIAAYRALLAKRKPSEVIVSGVSAGGNLAAALVLRAKDEGLPMPAGVILATPEVDLTESGDSFQANLGVDPSLKPLMPVNLLYANGYDLKHPYLSPLFGDLAGFPPTILITGTRDLFLSNTVRMHRALRAAGREAELHVTEAAGHVGFPGAPEGAAIDAEVRGFIGRVLNPVR